MTELDHRRKCIGGRGHVGVPTAYERGATSTTYGTPQRDGSLVNRAALRDFDADNRFACFVCQKAGLACVIGECQLWRVDNYELTVELQLDSRAFYVLYIRAGWPSSTNLRRRKALCLTEAYAIDLIGQIRTFGRPELARLRVKALTEAGLIDPTPVQLPMLPDDAPGAAVETWKLIEELATIRAATGDWGPMPLVAPWLASLNGTNEATIRYGKAWLELTGRIIHVDDGPGRFGKPMKLWEIPGLDDATGK